MPRGLDRVSQGSTRFDSVRHVTGRRCRPTGLSRRAAIPLHAYLPTAAECSVGTLYALIGRPPGLLVHGARYGFRGQRRVGVVAPSCFPSFWGFSALRVWPKFSLTGSGRSGRRGAKVAVWQPPCGRGCRFTGPDVSRACLGSSSSRSPGVVVRRVQLRALPPRARDTSALQVSAARGGRGGDTSQPR